MRNIFILWILILPVTLFGQKDTAKLFEPSLIKADIDTLIHKLKVVHPTFLNYYNENNIQGKIDSIMKNINHPMSSLDLFGIMQPIVCIDGHTSLTYTEEIYPKMDNPFFPFNVIIWICRLN